MKTTPSIEAARIYLNDHLLMPAGTIGRFELLHRKTRLWMCKGQTKVTIVHVCKPRKLLHYMLKHSPSKLDWSGPFTGEVVDGSHWHTQKISYRCRVCGTIFDGGVAFAIRVGLHEKERLEG